MPPFVWRSQTELLPGFCVSGMEAEADRLEFWRFSRWELLSEGESIESACRLVRQAARPSRPLPDSQASYDSVLDGGDIAEECKWA